MSATISPSAAADVAGSGFDLPLPVVRSPILDREGQLFAYELLFHREIADSARDAALMQRVLSTISDGSMTRLVRGNRAFLRLSRELLLEKIDVLAHHPRIGVIVEPAAVDDADLLQHLQQLSRRGCALLLELGVDDPATAALQPLLELISHVRIDAARLSAEQLNTRAEALAGRELCLIAGHVDDHAIHARCLRLPIRALQGRHLLLPEQVEVPVLTANRLSLLRLMGALQGSNPGPVELGELVRDDAVLSYKLLGCVNSAYFALPRQLKSIQQAAIFFGVSRMRIWIQTMALSGLDDRPPELLRAALIRAHMCERLADGLPAERREMAFLAGLLSLLDTLMCAPMEFVLSHLPLAAEIREALVDGRGPFAPMLAQVHAWEAGELSLDDTLPEDVRKMAGIYLEATQWADHVYAFAESSPA